MNGGRSEIYGRKLDADKRIFGIGEPGSKLDQGICHILDAIGAALGDCVRRHLIG